MLLINLLYIDQSDWPIQRVISTRGNISRPVNAENVLGGVAYKNKLYYRTACSKEAFWKSLNVVHWLNIFIRKVGVYPSCKSLQHMYALVLVRILCTATAGYYFLFGTHSNYFNCFSDTHHSPVELYTKYYSVHMQNRPLLLWCSPIGAIVHKNIRISIVMVRNGVDYKLIVSVYMR